MAAELLDSIHCSSRGDPSPCSRGLENPGNIVLREREHNAYGAD